MRFWNPMKANRHLSSLALQENYDDAIEAWNDEINRRKARDDEIERLRGLLAKHGRCADDCASVIYDDFTGVLVVSPDKCDCGWQAIAKELGL